MPAVACAGPAWRKRYCRATSPSMVAARRWGALLAHRLRNSSILDRLHLPLNKVASVNRRRFGLALLFFDVARLLTR